ncbi:hypothetical protein CHISP_3173 [Chitinispirillum alkaliphilum]|nr:hypothetical protein CHISP_3173 [Chitinispirillum alkaliphilum]
MILQIVVLGLAAYGLMLPLVSPVAKKVAPEVWSCTYNRIKGHDCPLCGFTRSVEKMYHRQWLQVPRKFLVIASLILFEMVFRVFVLVLLLKKILSRTQLKKIMALDMIFHLLVTVGGVSFLLVSLR